MYYSNALFYIKWARTKQGVVLHLALLKNRFVRNLFFIFQVPVVCC
jgi:hypothetical protein